MMVDFQALPQISIVSDELPLGSKSAAAALHVLFAADKDAFDGTVVVFSGGEFKDESKRRALPPFIAGYAEHNRAFDQDVHLFVANHGHRIVASPVKGLNGDCDDVRRLLDALAKGLRRMRASGPCPRLRIVLPDLVSTSKFPEEYEQHVAACLLSVLGELHEQLQARETLEHEKFVDGLVKVLEFVLHRPVPNAAELLRFVTAVEQGRRLARDIGGADPERMPPFQCAEAIQKYLVHYKLDGVIRCHVERDVAVIAREYPLLFAVARASLASERHRPCVVTLEYASGEPEKVLEHLFLVGKGVTYDTGGHDIKVGGGMTGMSRDKCGAAALAGFMASVGHLSPAHLNVTCRLAFVRNAVGPEGYVADELLRARSGVRVKVGNTDAEGRMAMADLLCAARQDALQAASGHKARILTCATLTGHAKRSVGPYPIAMDNGPARSTGIAVSLQSAGALLGEPVEISRVRREDFGAIDNGGSPRYDVLQISKERDGSRGHQYPAAFLTVASGLDKCGRDSATPLCYTHLDIAGCAEELDGDRRPTAAPLLALTGRFLAGLGTAAKRFLP
jgi:leucyl aminopeptidase